MNDFDLGGISFVYINKNVILKFLGILGVRIFKHLYMDLNSIHHYSLYYHHFCYYYRRCHRHHHSKKIKKNLGSLGALLSALTKWVVPTMELTHFVRFRSNVLGLPKYCPSFNSHYNHFYCHHYYH